MVCVLAAEWANGLLAANLWRERDGDVTHTTSRRWRTLVIGLLAAILIAMAIRGVVGPRWIERQAVPAKASQPTAAASTKTATNDRPALWILAIGVSHYAEPSLNLRFAAADASAVADALASQQGGPLYHEVNTAVLVDAAVTRSSILRALDEFLGKAASIDVGVIYMAGHGVRDDALDSYYFLPATASAEKPRIEGLDMDDFNRQLRMLHRNLGQLVVILDTCHAGAVAAAPRERIAIMHFDNLRPSPQHDWMQQALGEQFATALHQVPRFDVYDERMVRFLARGTADPIEASRRADMTKLVTGTYWVNNNAISITAHVKNTNPLKSIASAQIDGPLEQFSELTGQVVVNLLQQMQLELSPT
jgi:TolB-like protein